jgi:hypothetical protein
VIGYVEETVHADLIRLTCRAFKPAGLQGSPKISVSGLELREFAACDLLFARFKVIEADRPIEIWQFAVGAAGQNGEDSAEQVDD